VDNRADPEAGPKYPLELSPSRGKFSSGFCDRSRPGYPQGKTFCVSSITK
jgi:hypothetical protein